MTTLLSHFIVYIVRSSNNIRLSPKFLKINIKFDKEDKS